MTNSKGNNEIRESSNCSNCKYGVNEKHKYFSEGRHIEQEGELYCSKKNCHVGRFLSCPNWEKSK